MFLSNRSSCRKISSALVAQGFEIHRRMVNEDCVKLSESQQTQKKILCDREDESHSSIIMHGLMRTVTMDY